MNTLITTDKDRFLLNFEGQDFSSEAKTFLKTRESAFQALSRMEFPTSKDEEWKYTRVKPILNQEFAPQTSINVKSVDDLVIPNWEGHLLVFVNGFYAPKLSNIVEEEVDFKLATMKEAKSEHAELVDPFYGSVAKFKEEVFTALNTAYSNNGLFLHLPKNTNLKYPIHVLFINEGEKVAVQPRNLIIAEKNSSADVVFTYHSLDYECSFSNAVTEIIAKDNTKISINKVQLLNNNSFGIDRDAVIQERDSKVEVNTFTFGGKIQRNDLVFHSNGSNTVSDLNGLYMTINDQHVDNHTKVFHNQPGCESNENYKGIIGGKSTGVFNGKVYVDKKAQQTNAFQSNANILMTDDATINSKPELEIYADDVKCSHGSTTGQFDEEAVFFLRARGIGEEKAKEIMVKAFAEEVLDSVSNEALRNWIEVFMERQLSKTQDV